MAVLIPRVKMMVLAIETERLALRNYCMEDWVQVHAYARDPEVVRFMDWGPNSERETQAFIAQAMATEGQSPRKEYELAVFLKDTGALIGGVTLKVTDSTPQDAEMGYTLHRLAWGQGLGTEIAREMVKFGFLQMGARRVWAKCRPENVGSFRVLKKAGMQFEEYVLNDKFVRGRLVDSFLCGINREDWLRTRKGDALAASGGRGTDC